MATLSLPTRGPLATRLARHVGIAVIGLVVVLVLLQILSPFRVTQFTNMGYLAIAAAGMTLLTGLSGQLSIGHGAFMAIGAYTTALLLGDGEGNLPLVVVLLVATFVSVVVGAIVGVAAARLHGPYVAGATLALAVAVPAVAIVFTEQLGGEQGLTLVVPPAPGWLLDASFFLTGTEMDDTGYIALVAWVCLLVTFVVLANLSRSRVGRVWRALRDDDVAAELAGVNLSRARIVAFVVSTACAGLAGAVMALSVRIAAPSGFGLSLSLLLLCVIVLGGLGSLAGALVGAGLLTFLPQVVRQIATNAGMDGISAAQLSPLIYGLVVMAVILMAPSGLVGSILRARHRRRGHHTTMPTTRHGAPAMANPRRSE
ncbi:branched-chain amino acid ABC transporter permease [Dactylosporangium sp. CA-092794]|uniref:branched-chain amino acid ABC transporter permease n=1 Tax=Dactylosporangium sp. CA-092794 TaxID=3239929 RepID=UPI003D9425B7